MVLTKTQLQQLADFADRGLATVVTSLAQQPGQAAEIARVSTLATELFAAVRQEIVSFDCQEKEPK